LTLVDANILMVAAGAEHAHKTPSLELLEGDAEGRAGTFTNVLQDAPQQCPQLGVNYSRGAKSSVPERASDCQLRARSPSWKPYLVTDARRSM